MNADDNTYQMMVCVTCYFLIANGEGDPEWTQEQHDEHLRTMDKFCGDLSLALGDSENDHEFSWSSCDSCRSTLGGSRHEVIGFEHRNTMEAK